MTKEDTLKLLEDLNNKITSMTAAEVLARARETNALQYFCDTASHEGSAMPIMDTFFTKAPPVITISSITNEREDEIISWQIKKFIQPVKLYNPRYISTELEIA